MVLAPRLVAAASAPARRSVIPVSDAQMSSSALPMNVALGQAWVAHWSQSRSLVSGAALQLN